MSNMTVYESFATAEYLSWYPEDKSYAEVLEMLRANDPLVIPWEHFDRIDTIWLADVIESLRVGLEDAFLPRKDYH